MISQKPLVEILPCQVIDVPGKGEIDVLEFIKRTNGEIASVPRVYWLVTGEKSELRGGHYHKPPHLEFWVCLRGTCQVKLRLPGREETYEMKSHREVLVIRPGVWHEVVLDANTILLVCSNTLYEAGESIAAENGMIF